MRKCILPIACFISSALCYGQNDYVITTQRDTVKGTVQILLPAERYEEITIETENDSRRLKAFQLLELRKDSLIYKSVKLGEVYRIMQLEKDGYLSLLSFRPDGNYAFGSKYLLKKSGEGIEVPTLLFKKLMADFLSDCDEVESKIKDKTYKRSDLEAIVTNYNECIQSQTVDLYTAAKEVKTPPVETLAPGAVSDKLQTIRKKLQTIRSGEAPELTVLLNDVESKLKKGEKVPSYMLSALKEQGAKLNDVNQDVTELVELLNQQQ